MGASCVRRRPKRPRSGRRHGSAAPGASGTLDSVQINFGGREIALKLVYYGPALSGKTTNLRSLHQLTSEGSRGRLMTLETKDDRTLFFDMLPLTLRSEQGSGQGMTLRIKIFTVPGQVLHASTRRLVLQGADGVAFIADSQISETEHNAASFLDLRQNLNELGLSLKQLPVVIQFNKRDLDKIRSDEEIDVLARRGREAVFKASAVAGPGVLETFFGLLHMTWTKLDREHQLAKLLGVGSGDLIPMALRQLGVTTELGVLLSACVGGNLERHLKVLA
jgi:signal recognition particle receptor subunit beta